MSVALFIYKCIYCRYLAPGECIVYDRGEFCNKVSELLAVKFNCPIRVISAGRPQANGQAEAYVKQMKARIQAKMVEASQDELPDNWDESLLPYALQVLRADPSCASGYAPAELLLGRQLVYPIELENTEIDFSGTTLAQPLVDTLLSIHDDAFGKAGAKIKKFQERYERAYDRRHEINELKLRRGMKVQIKKFIEKRGDESKGRLKVSWKPFRSYYKVHSYDKKKGVITVRSKNGRVYKKRHPITRVRIWKGN